MAHKSRRARPAARSQPARTHTPVRKPFILDVIANAPPTRIAFALVAVHVLFCLLSFIPAPFTGGDNFAYITLANSLLHQHKYLELYDPAQTPHTQYPPVYPLILAGAIAL